MSNRLSILALMISSSIFCGAVVSQYMVTPESWISTDILSSGQEMTWSDRENVWYEELENLPLVYEIWSGEEEIFTGRWTSGTLITGTSMTGEMTSLTPPYLQITEVYVDGTDEWIEITNQGEQMFSGNITIQGVKSTALTIKNIVISWMTSQLFGDTLAQVLDTSCINKTGLGLNMWDTVAIAIILSASWQTNDSFGVHAEEVERENDTKTSFERRGTTIVPVTPERIRNAWSGYMINPGVYFSGERQEEISWPPMHSTGESIIPCSGWTIIEDSPIQIREIFGGKQNTPWYIELAIQEDMVINSLFISWDLIWWFYEFSWVNTGIAIQKNTFLLLEATNARANQRLSSVQFSWVSIGSTWHIITLWRGSGQTRQVLDIVYVSGTNVGKSWYFGEKTVQCARIFDLVDDFSPGFARQFLQYMPVRTETKIEYITTGWTCSTSSTGLSISGQMVGESWTITGLYTIQILHVEYDPPGSDTNNETITLLAHHNSGDTTPLDMSKIFRVKVNGSNKLLSWWLPMDTPTTFTKTFGFPNSTDDESAVSIELTYGDHVFATYTYTPNPLPIQETKEETTGYYVSSVVDGKTFRIKYQWITQTAKLIGIDIPETLSESSPLSCFVVETKQYLKNLIDKQKVTIEFDPLQPQRDVQGNLLVYAYKDDLLINQYLLEQWYAKLATWTTPYLQQSPRQDIYQSAQQQEVGLRSSHVCGISWSGVQWSESVITGIVMTGNDIVWSWLSVHISYVLPNPIGKDIHEEVWILMQYLSGTHGNDTRDLSQWFTLHIGNKIKKLQGIVHAGKEYLLSGNLGLTNSATCIGLRYQDKELTTRCYTTAKEWVKIWENNQLFSSISTEQKQRLSQLQLKKIDNKLCIRYVDQSWICKTIPAGKAAAKTIAEQKLYKWLVSILKAYLLDDRKQLYYSTDIKTYYDILTTNKAYIAKGWTQRNVYGQMVPVTDIKKQLHIIQHTLPGIVSLFAGQQWLE